YESPQRPIAAAALPRAIQLSEAQSNEKEDRGQVEQQRRRKAESQYRDPEPSLVAFGGVLPCDKNQPGESKNHAVRPRLVNVISGAGHKRKEGGDQTGHRAGMA